MNKTLILFDIDGTLLDTSGAGRRSFMRALDDVFGWGDDARNLTFAGATDLDLLTRLAERRGRTLSRGQVEDFFGRLPGALRTALQADPPHVYPGVRELLETLSARDDVCLGLVTGNIETCAWVKLESCHLHGHFTLGAFGHEHADRCDIARLARQRAEQAAGGPTAFRACHLIGDTPSDIRAAQAIGATALAVATGGYDATRLREAGAHQVWADLSDTSQIVERLGLI
jgi:phosphoglycolate phosphatase-like HAD superfamily hydrolase